MTFNSLSTKILSPTDIDRFRSKSALANMDSPTWTSELTCKVPPLDRDPATCWFAPTEISERKNDSPETRRSSYKSQNPPTRISLVSCEGPPTDKDSVNRVPPRTNKSPLRTASSEMEHFPARKSSPTEIDDSNSASAST